MDHVARFFTPRIFFTQQHDSQAKIWLWNSLYLKNFEFRLFIKSFIFYCSVANHACFINARPPKLGFLPTNKAYIALSHQQTRSQQNIFKQDMHSALSNKGFMLWKRLRPDRQETGFLATRLQNVRRAAFLCTV